MGAADVIPGVSGGTIAFITGIYDHLLNSINAFNPKNLQLLLKGNFREFFDRVNVWFLVSLLAGVGTAIISLAKGITYLMEHHPVHLWSFFFGLIVASSFLVMKQIKTWKIWNFVFMIVGVALAWYLTSDSKIYLPENLLGYFFAGFIAIIAMILPGISGSYILLMMGKYDKVIGIIASLSEGNFSDLPTLIIFAIGCASGLLFFARILRWLLDHYHDPMVSALVGFMLGSLNKVWPWKETVEWMVDRHGETIPAKQVNILPPAIDNHFWIAVALAVGGLLLVVGLEMLGNRTQKKTA